MQIVARLVRVVAASLMIWSFTTQDGISQISQVGNCRPNNGEEAIIKICEQLIRAGQYRGAQLAALHAFLGTGFLNTDQYDRALRAFDEAIRIEGNASHYFYWRAHVHANRDDARKTQDDMENAIRLSPTDSRYQKFLGEFFARRSDHGKAISAFTEAIRLRPKEEDYYYLRGQSHTARRDYDRAIADYNEAIKIEPKFARCILVRALAHLMKGNTALGEADLDELVRLAPVNRIETDYIRYLKEIQDDKDYANYAGAPLEAYWKGRAN